MKQPPAERKRAIERSQDEILFSFVNSLASANTAATAPDNLRHPNALLSQVLHDLRLIYANHLNIVYPLPL